MKRERSRQGRWLPLLLMLVMGLIATPVAETLASPRASTTTLGSTVYLTTATLKPLFQKQIDQKTGTVAQSTISGMTSTMAPQNRGWASQMANALIKPTATITDMTTQKDGILTTISVSLYPGEPFPVASRILVKFSILDPSTIQVSSQHVSGPVLVSDGSLTTLKVSMGKLQSIKTTPSCGDAALAIQLQFTVALDDTTASTNAPGTTTAPGKNPVTTKLPQQGDTVDAYVEVPQSSLDTLAQSIDSLAVSNTMHTQNLHVSINNKTLIMTSDLSLWETGVVVASTKTTIQPGVQNGQVHFQVTKTGLTVAFLTFNGNSYNQQIETLLNQKIGNALTGKFTTTSAAVGNNTHVPCASNTNLMLVGKTNVG